MNKLLKNRLKPHKPWSKSRVFKPETYTSLMNPIWQTFLWFGALLWGALASLMATEILDFVPPGSVENWWDLPIHLPSTIFATTALVLIVLFSLSRWVTSAQDRIVLDSMLTMPPHDFWTYFGENYDKTSQDVDKYSVVALEKVGEAIDEMDKDAFSKHNKELLVLRDEMNQGVREVLDAMINLVKKWDASNLHSKSVIYRANVMTVTYFGEGDGLTAIDSERATHLNELAKDYTVQPFGSHYSGFVALENSIFTTTTETSQSTPDSRKPIAFPFTLKSNQLESPITSNYLGAPEAVVSGKPSYVTNVDEIPSNYKKGGGIFDSAIYQRLCKYYSDKTVAHSILSIPLQDGESHESQHVLNIYRNQEGLLFDGSKVSDFTNIILPYSTTLGRLLSSIKLFDGLYEKRINKAVELNIYDPNEA
ncbi:hypothetical protein [Vibrio penaeicida]|uniref:hypothetical protein n=1 Tax=Vibrio penaeicida TaxID=104609 RepID=UPI001CC771E9|nr:hypothetical protein [Vibrio penaeicida]